MATHRMATLHLATLFDPLCGPAPPPPPAPPGPAFIIIKAEAHFTMLRVWDGGVWEPSAFYDACDEMGVMIYHDMQFSGSHLEWYSQADFQVAREELQYQIQRLSHHREYGPPSHFMSSVCISRVAGFALQRL